MDRLIPYSTDVYNAIISDHNLSLWPLQVFVVVLCLSVIGLARRGGANNVAFMILAVFWIWYGVHFRPFSYHDLRNDQQGGTLLRLCIYHPRCGDRFMDFLDAGSIC